MPLRKFVRLVRPIRLSEVLSLMESLAYEHSKTRWWYGTPLRTLIDIAGDVSLRELGPEHIRAWQEHIRSGVSERTGRRRSDHTINSYQRALRATLNKMVELRHLEPEKARRLLKAVTVVRLPDPEPKHLSPEEVAALVRHAAHKPREFAMLHVLRASGIRVGGLRSMRMSRLEMWQEPVENDTLAKLVAAARALGLSDAIRPDAAGRWRAKFVVVGKGQKGRQKAYLAFLDHEAVVALRAYLDTRPAGAPDEVWLTAAGDKPLGESALYAAFKRVAADAGIDASPHDLRHTFAHRLVSAGVDMKTTAVLLGHSDPTLTARIYYNPTSEDLQRVYERVSREERARNGRG